MDSINLDQITNEDIDHIRQIFANFKEEIGNDNVDIKEAFLSIFARMELYIKMRKFFEEEVSSRQQECAQRITTLSGVSSTLVPEALKLSRDKKRDPASDERFATIMAMASDNRALVVEKKFLDSFGSSLQLLRDEVEKDCKTVFMIGELGEQRD